MKLLNMILTSLILTSTAQAAIPVFERARVNIYIYKSTIEREGDDFKWNEEAICRKTLEIDVLDLRGGMEGPYPINEVVCETTYEGKPFHLTLGSHSVVDKVKLPGRQAIEDIKIYMSFLGGTLPGPFQSANFPEIPAGVSAYTTDLALRNMIQNLVPNQGLMCLQPGGPINSVPMNLGTTSLSKKILNRSNNIPESASSTEDCQIFNYVAFGAVVEYETL